MPIVCRCTHCNQKLSIASRKAGQDVKCPACSQRFTVPVPDELNKPEPPADEATEFTAAEPPAAEFELAGSTAAETGDSWDDSGSDAADSAADNDGGDRLAALFDEPDAPDEAPPDERGFDDSESADDYDDYESDDFGSEDYEDFEPAAASDNNGVQASAGALAATATGGSGGRRFDDEFDDDDDDEGFTLSGASMESDEMDLTPMVDVTFLLLIFFMITASFSLQKTIDVPPPNPEEKGATQSVQQEDLEATSVMVGIDESNGLTVDDVPLPDKSALVDVLQDKLVTEDKTELALIVNPKALHDTVIFVVDAAQEVGMQKIRMATYGGE